MSSPMTKEKVSRDCKEKRVMGCDALFRLMKIKTFTRRNIFRVFYLDENGVLVSTNALRLEFGTIRLEDRETESEIVYFHFDAVGGRHILYRSACRLEKDEGRGEWKITHERNLSRVEICHLKELIDLYVSCVEKRGEHFNLTTLRKVACRKYGDISREVYLQNFASNDDIASCPVLLTPTSNVTRHVLQLQLHANCVVFSHKQYDFPSTSERSLDYLVKKDILAYVDFLNLTQTILAFENEQGNENAANNGSVFRSSIMKLDYISEQLSRVREKNKVLKRKRKFRDICDEALDVAPSSLIVSDDARSNPPANDLFFLEDLIQQM